MKKLLVLTIFAVTHFTNAQVVEKRSKGPLEGSPYMRFVNDGLEQEGDNSGAYINEIISSGREAQGILMEVHKLYKLHGNKEEMMKFVHLLRAGDAKDAKKEEETKSKTKSLEETKEELKDQDLGALEAEVVDILKKRLLDSRVGFLLKLHEVSPLLEPLVRTSLKNAKNFKQEDSLLLLFMKAKSTEASKYFYNVIVDATTLKQVCSEFTRFCHDLWGALSTKLKVSRLRWLEQQKKAKETGK